MTAKPENKYQVMEKGSEPEKTINPDIEIQLTDIALVNLHNSFYYLRRVSDNGLCGVETATNYVLDPHATEKEGNIASWTTKQESYFYNLEQPETWSWTELSSLADAEEDNYDKDDYRIWRYVTENTIPNDDNQVHSISTGIVFKGQILPSANCDNAELEEALEAGKEPVYVHENKLYGTWAMVKKIADAEGANPDLKNDYYAVEKAVSDGKDREEMETYVGFTRYTPNEEGVYETYYYYWNRHNDNGVDDPTDENRMGPMEFAVVRNNVYKLKVDALYGFGSPSTDTPPGDTDEPGPKDSDPTYILVNVKVIPWVTHDYTITIDQGNSDGGDDNEQNEDKNN